MGAKIAGYCIRSEVLDEALAEFADSYGDQTETDHASLVKAIKRGCVKAVEAYEPGGTIRFNIVRFWPGFC